MSRMGQSELDEAKEIIGRLIASGLTPEQIFKEAENAGVKLNEQLKYICRSVYNDSQAKR